MSTTINQRLGPIYYTGAGTLFDAPANGEPAGFIDNWSDSSTTALKGNANNNIMVGDLLGTGSYNTEIDTIFGNGGDDTIYGDTGPTGGLYADASWKTRTEGSSDNLYGDAGRDRIYGGGGSDFIYGGKDDDRLYQMGGDGTMDGNSGNDKLYGGTGSNSLFGGRGIDYLYGYAGNDLLVGEGNFTDRAGTLSLASIIADDRDYLFGGDGEDDLYGGNGSDYLYGGNQNDRLFGGSYSGFTDTKYTDKADYLYGEAGNDDLRGNEGNDYLYGGTGNDSLNGEDGNDRLDGGEGNDRINGGFEISSSDTVSYAKSDGLVRIDLRISVAQNTVSQGMDTIERIENITGSAYADRLIGDDGANTISGRNGADSISGLGGNDKLYGGDGADSISGGDGKDTLSGSLGADTLKGGTGNDRMTGGAAADQLYGNSGSDTFVYLATSDSTVSARDTIHGFASGDRIDVSAIDANTLTSANNAFVKDLGGSFSAGEYRIATISPGVLQLSFNTDTDSTIEMQIRLSGATVSASGVTLIA